MLLYGELNVLLLAHQVDAKRAYLFQEKEDLMLEGQYLQKNILYGKKFYPKWYALSLKKNSVNTAPESETWGFG